MIRFILSAAFVAMAFSSHLASANLENSAFRGPFLVNTFQFVQEAVQRGRVLVPSLQATDCSLSFADFAISVADNGSAANHSRLQIVCDIPAEFNLAEGMKLLIGATTSGAWIYELIPSATEVGQERALEITVLFKAQTSDADKKKFSDELQATYPSLTINLLDDINMLIVSIINPDSLEVMPEAYPQMLSAVEAIKHNEQLESLELSHVEYRQPNWPGAVTQLNYVDQSFDLAPFHRIGTALEYQGWWFQTLLSLPVPLGSGPIYQ